MPCQAACPPSTGLQVAVYLDLHGKVVSAGLAAAAEIWPEFSQAFLEPIRQLALPREPGAAGHGKVVTNVECGAGAGRR